MSDSGSVAISMTKVSVSVANIFDDSSTEADHGYHSFGELVRFIYCLLQKIKKSPSLPLVEQWEEYVVANHLRFPAIDEKDFLAGTPVITALDKAGIQFLRTEFRRDARRFFAEFVNCLLSTVALRSLIGQRRSCFCPAFVVAGDNVAPFQLFNKLLDGFFEKGWTRGSEVEACRAENQFFVQEQRQLKRLSTRSRTDVGDALSLCSAQPGFHARQHLCKVCILSNHACCIVFSCVDSYCSGDCAASGVPVNSTRHPWSCSSWRKVFCQPWSCRHPGRSAWCLALCASFCSEPSIHTKKLLRFWLDNAVWVWCHCQ